LPTDCRSADKRKTFRVYEAPSAEAIRRTASRNKLPVERITEVRVLDPRKLADRVFGERRARDAVRAGCEKVF
jgi:hypothetical protein